MKNKAKISLERLRIDSFITAPRYIHGGRALAKESELDSECAKTCIPDCSVAGTCEC